MTTRVLVRLLLISGLVLACEGCRAPQPEKRELLIAAAADLRFAMDELGHAFQLRHPEITVRISYGSSGQFFQQLQHGAPFDLFCSADLAYPKGLVEEGIAIKGSEFLYAIGRIVVWVPNSSSIRLDGISALRDPAIRHIAIANPAHAPYGKAAVAAMQTLGVYESVKDKLVFGENVSEALQFAQSGAAEISIVALSLALAPTLRQTGRYWQIPETAYPRMDQGGAIMKATKNADAAAAFRSFMLSEQGRNVLRNYGFYLPE